MKLWQKIWSACGLPLYKRFYGTYSIFKPPEPDRNWCVNWFEQNQFKCYGPTSYDTCVHLISRLMERRGTRDFRIERYESFKAPRGLGPYHFTPVRERGGPDKLFSKELL